MPPDPSGWGWPLDGIQRWFEDLWNWISQAAMSAVAIVSDWVWSAVRWVGDRFSEGLGWVKDAVGSFVSGLWTSISGAFNALSSAIGSFVSNLWANISQFLTNVSNTLGAALSSIGSSILSGLGSLGESLGKGLSGIVSVVSSSVGNAVNTIGASLNGAMSVVGSWLSDALAGVAKALGDALGGFANWFISGLKGLASTLAQGLKGIMDALSEILRPIVVGFMDSLKAAFTPGSPDKELEKSVNAMVETTQKRILEELKKAYKSPFDPGQAIITSGVISGLVLAGQVMVHTLASAAGVSVLGTRLDLTDVVESAVDTMGLNRVVGSSFALPIEIGMLQPLRYAYNQMFTPSIPGPGDLIRFVVREVIDVSIFRTNLAYQGFSAFWADAFWEAHWELPARGEILDAFHRGVLSEAEKDKFMVWHDYKPEARPGIGKSDLAILKGIEKALIGRVDLRRGYELGRLSKADLVERFRWLGFEDDAELIAEIQIRAAMDAEIGKLRDNAKTDFIKGYIVEKDLRTTLEALGYGPDVVEFHVQDAVQDRERSRKDLLVNNYIDAYVKGLIDTEDELQALLGEVIVDPDLVQAKVEDAYITRYKKPKAS